MGEVLRNLREAVGQASEPAHLRPDVEILGLDVAGPDVLHVGLPMTGALPQPCRRRGGTDARSRWRLGARRRGMWPAATRYSRSSRSSRFLREVRRRFLREVTLHPDRVQLAAQPPHFVLGTAAPALELHGRAAESPLALAQHVRTNRQLPTNLRQAHLRTPSRLHPPHGLAFRLHAIDPTRSLLAIRSLQPTTAVGSALKTVRSRARGSPQAR